MAERQRLHGRRYYLKYKYGITQEWFESMFEAQGGRCAICRKVAELKPNDAHRHDRRSWKNGLVVDHDHETGQLRELLCPSCNSAIGLLQEDPALLCAAAAYIERHR